MARKVQIEILAGPNVGEARDFELDTILVGRGTQCAMQLASPHVSRQQCELSWQGDQLVLENLGTVNVTYLNDRPIERVYVQDGDLVTFCDVALRVRIVRGADSPKTAVYGQREQVGARPSAAPPSPPMAQMPPTQPLPAAPAGPLPGMGSPGVQTRPRQPSVPAAPPPVAPPRVPTRQEPGRGAEPTMMNQGMPPSAAAPPPRPVPMQQGPGPAPSALSAAGYGSMVGVATVQGGQGNPLASPPTAPPMMAPPVAPPSAWTGGSPPTTAVHPSQMSALSVPNPHQPPPAAVPGPFPGGGGTGQHAAIRGGGPRPPGMPPGPPAPGMPSMAGMASIPGLGAVRPASPTSLGPNQVRGGEVTAPPGPAPFDNGGVATARRSKGAKKKAEAAANLRLVRNIVLVSMGLVLLICATYLVTNKGSAKKKPRGSTSVAASKEAAASGTAGGGAAEPTPAPSAVRIDRGARTDDELLAEGARLQNIGATYLREYRFDDGNLDLSISYFEKSRGHFALVDPARHPPTAIEIDARIQEARGLLDQEFRKAKISYVREKQSGRYEQAMEELERILRLFPDKDDERHQFAKKQQQDVRALMAGGKRNDGPF